MSLKLRFDSFHLESCFLNFNLIDCNDENLFIFFFIEWKVNREESLGLKILILNGLTNSEDKCWSLSLIHELN